ncbi:hypothetical protein DKM28_10295 [Methanosarcina mazei]|uniref:Uncharacterized protein n=1 Tax=Methanosarcina mazei TaxID=2209 RepID=A0A0F8P462_METMZ|nr:hypothetical protein DU43_00790 [Methanosarcina mazei]KKH31579.1 hypothetical protein DU58_10300 [Methanosarcina mazei]QCR16357.1 hypothetical protein DKM28_10295 [Methanosarcina mazei]
MGYFLADSLYFFPKNTYFLKVKLLFLLFPFLFSHIFKGSFSLLYFSFYLYYNGSAEGHEYPFL